LAHGASLTAHFTDVRLLEVADAADIGVPRGEPRRLVAEVARTLVRRPPEEQLRAAVAAAADALWDDEARTKAAAAAADDAELAALIDVPAAESPVAAAVAYRAALPLLARDEAVTSTLTALEPVLAQFDDEDRARFAPVLARAAVPALALDVEQLKDEGYRYVASYPPEGSEGVDIVGKASSWLTRRMTMDGDAPRLAMRRFLAVLAEEVEIDLPASAAALDELLAEPMPEAVGQDRMFLSLARGLVEEAVAERGFPF
jgi:hypothetical protein